MKVVNDLGAPAAVVAVDLITEKFAPDWNEWATYLMAIGGYAGALLNFGGDFVKNMGIAAFPAAAHNVYNRFAAGTSRKASSRLAFRPAAQYTGIRQTVVPEYSDVKMS
ncbi:MAG: hypothetical protein WC359_13660 [Dehalococcoidia bacterium]|jgi:hypothetical protein